MTAQSNFGTGLRQDCNVPWKAIPSQSRVFSPDCGIVASDSDGHMIKLWDPTSGALLHTIHINGVVTDVIFETWPVS